MAHYAFLDENNIVVNVIVGIEETELISYFDTETGLMASLDPETYYGNKANMRCVRTSFNTIGNIHQAGKTPFRKNYAQVGNKYDEVGFFSLEKPFESWTFNTDTYLYDAPIAKPIKNQSYKNWNSEISDWENVFIPNLLDYEWDELNQRWKIVQSIDSNGILSNIGQSDYPVFLV